MSADHDHRVSKPSLEGIRVLDFTQNLPGPYASLLLAAMGAEVIKVEPPRGDSGRMLGSLFDLVNAGKKSVVLDLKRPEERERLDRLLPTVDVLLEGFRPGVARALGAGPSHAMALNPGLVYCSMSGYGQTGPYRTYPGHDLNFQAVSGVCQLMRDASERPQGCALPIADLSSGLSAVASVVAALFARQRDGHGRRIDIALTDTVLSWAHLWSEGLTPHDARPSSLLPRLSHWLDTTGAAALPPSTRPHLDRARIWLGSDRAARGADRLAQTRAWRELKRLRLRALPHYALYQTSDSRFISVGIVDEHKFWVALCEGLGLPHSVHRAMNNLPLAARVVTSPPLRRIIARAFRRHSLDHWLRTLDRSMVPVAPVLPIEQAVDDPQLRSRIHELAGGPATPYPFAQVPLSSAPRLGEHTQSLLSETLADAN